MLKKILILALMSIPMAVLAKRAPPPEVKPISYEGFQYLPDIESSPTEMKVYLKKISRKTKEEEWRTELYSVKFDTKMETDVQTIFPTNLKWNKKSRPELTDEHGSHYVVSPKDGHLIRPSKAVVYNKSK